MQSTRDFLVFLEVALAAHTVFPDSRQDILNAALAEFTSRVQEDAYVLAARRIVATPPTGQTAAPLPKGRPKGRAHG